MTLRLSLRDPADPAAASSDDPGAGERSFLLDVTDDTSVAEVAESLGVDPSLVAPTVHPDTALVDAPVLNGQTLPPQEAPALHPGQPRLEVVGGPFAGEVVPLAAGTPLRIGSGAGVDLRIADPWLAGHHVTLTLDPVDEAAGARRGPLAARLSVVEGAAAVAVNG